MQAKRGCEDASPASSFKGLERNETITGIRGCFPIWLVYERLKTPKAVAGNVLEMWEYSRK